MIFITGHSVVQLDFTCSVNVVVDCGMTLLRTKGQIAFIFSKLGSNGY